MPTSRDMGGLSAAGSSLTTASSGFLDPIVDIPLQQHHAWCWAAVLEGVSIRDRRGLRQCDIVSTVVGTPSCPSSPGGPVIGRDNDFCSITYALKKLKWPPPSLSGKRVNFATVCNWLSRGLVVAGFIAPQDNGTGHWIGLTGYGSDGQVYVDDPWPVRPFQGLVPYGLVLDRYEHGPFDKGPGQLTDMFGV